MRELGVQKLIASCLNDACRHVALIDLWSYPGETEIQYFKSRVVCAKCGSRGNNIDVQPIGKSSHREAFGVCGSDSQVSPNGATDPRALGVGAPWFVRRHNHRNASLGPEY
jgi:hypothetical protein